MDEQIEPSGWTVESAKAYLGLTDPVDIDEVIILLAGLRKMLVGVNYMRREHARLKETVAHG